MNLNWLKARQTKYTAYVALYIAIILAVVSVANFLAQRYNKSYDSTSNKRFSLSDQTEKIVKGLQRDVKITYFNQTGRFAEARDLLDRYDNLSTKLTVEFIDPDKKPQVARAAGVRSYGTVFVDTGERREEAKSVTEEEVTNALIRALKGGQRKACIVQGSGEHGLDDSDSRGYSSMKEAIENNNYTTETISLLQKPEVPADCTVLIVGGPRFDYLQPAVDAIRKYVEGGGRALVMLDPPLAVGKEDVRENAELAKLLESWGVTLNKNLVLDASGIGSLFGLSEAIPLVTDYESHAIVRDMRSIATAFPLTRSLETKTVDNVTVDKLFSTSPNSFATTNLSSAEIKLDPSKAKQGPFTIGAAGTVTVKDQASQPPPETPGAEAHAGKREGRFVVTGTSGWAANNLIRFNGNRDLLLNMMNWLSSDEDLISIRPKEPQDRRLSLTRQQMSRVFYASVVLLPLVVIGLGVSVWWRRR
ncbi:MAG: GldG family protein [Bryobacteraceae bacterium]|nr:GldG family protein [Bryobacteraceae bacterium]